jgi:hypothetical protein
MNSDNNNMHNTGVAPSVINPSMVNGNSSTDKKSGNKNAKVTLDKNGKPKRKKASRGMDLNPG